MDRGRRSGLGRRSGCGRRFAHCHRDPGPPRPLARRLLLPPLPRRNRPLVLPQASTCLPRVQLRCRQCHVLGVSDEVPSPTASHHFEIHVGLANPDHAQRPAVPVFVILHNADGLSEHKGRQRLLGRIPKRLPPFRGVDSDEPDLVLRLSDENRQRVVPPMVSIAGPPAPIEGARPGLRGPPPRPNRGAYGSQTPR